ncbi:hypothetical protein I5L34_09755 [Pseudomonas aeruginosa]|uniref:hypothetical protein n=1 Tax=Pseudomonas aeruginosa TaxID=287 RepID=UPI0012D94427|nr:hypothetical protein [Pseudomonas aeruginosa]MBH9458382.1 hypothetical protein [Pseudomonas aeruginosa]MBH9463567.1 hypothetical protein [Pseudomonas aeruginosa]MUI51656.1 hypothetical protein [Pseudomonas aeruginosa]HBO6772221.1 hypothetical protein [Pseudomonas aeruginosa]HCL3825522.1 hypothetical protein [Pseudomonas aeruginosa]
MSVNLEQRIAAIEAVFATHASANTNAIIELIGAVKKIPGFDGASFKKGLLDARSVSIEGGIQEHYDQLIDNFIAAIER